MYTFNLCNLVFTRLQFDASFLDCKRFGVAFQQNADNVIYHHYLIVRLHCLTGHQQLNQVEVFHHVLYHDVFQLQLIGCLMHINLCMYIRPPTSLRFFL